MERSKKIIQIGFIGIIVNLLLVGFKALAGMMTGSVAIMMDAVNNLSDALSSVITIIGTKLAGKAPNKKHPYGYGRIEYITSITIAGIVLTAGLSSLSGAVESIRHPAEASYTPVSLLIIVVAVFVKFILGRSVKKAGIRYHSDSLVASGTDAVFDAVISFSTLVAAGINVWLHVSIEGWLGGLISLVIVKAGLEILVESLGSIIGARVDSVLALQLKEHICKYPQVHGAYDLVLHRYGPERVIGSVHVEVDDEMNAREIHSLSRSIMEEVYTKFGIILTVGIYASNTADGLFAEMKAALARKVEEYPEVIQMHGFYVDSEQMRVSFDLIIDFEAKQKLEIRDAILQKMQEAYPAYQFSAVLDNDFSD